MNILVINAGSSSLKYQLLNPETGALLAKGLCERIGIDGKFTYKPQVEGKQVLDAVDVAMPTHSEAIQAVLNALVDKDNGVIGSMQEIDAVGHRVVHGGEAFAGSVLITDEVMKALEGFLRPEFINRVDEIVYFNRLSEENFKAIAKIMLTELRDNLSEKGITFSWDEALLDYLTRKSYSMTYGARNLRRLIQKDLEDAIATKIIDSYLHPLSQIRATAEGDTVTLLTL